jgi:uncharacterized protein (TIGR00725 family)
MVSTPKPTVMPLRIGVMGGAGSNIPQEHLDKAVRLGEAIADAGCVIITGACPGLPLAAARGAKGRGGMVVGISPGLSLDEHAYKYGSPTLAHDALIFTGSGLMGREVVNIRSSDVVVIVGGSTGTLGELAIAYDEGKLIGVLTETGGISGLVQDILAACNKDTGARVLYDDDPRRLVDSSWTSTARSISADPRFFVAVRASRCRLRARAASKTSFAGCGLLQATPLRGEQRTASASCSVRSNARNDSTPNRPHT